MGQKTILVCDVCERAATETVTIKIGNRNLVKDLCAEHVNEIAKGARRPRPGRRRGAVATPATSATRSTPARRGRPKKAAANGRKRPGRPRQAAANGRKRRGRPRKASAQPSR
jgi:hypothetical protein